MSLRAGLRLDPDNLGRASIPAEVPEQILLQYSLRRCAKSFKCETRVFLKVPCYLCDITFAQTDERAETLPGSPDGLKHSRFDSKLQHEVWFLSFLHSKSTHDDGLLDLWS